MNRDFKGVWIPKEIWLSKELTALEKVIFAEIHSLDNENHCTAGNEYFAEFCNCSQSAVTKTIKHLTDLGLIEVVSFDGRHRQLRVVNFTTHPSKIYEADSENLRAINTDNNIVNNTSNNSKELLLDEAESDDTFLGSVSKTKEKPKKKNLYQKCMDMINDFTDDAQFRDLLTTYLKYRLEIKDKPLYANMWKGMLRSLDGLCGDDDALGCEIVQQSINRGYLGFFKVNRYSATPSFDHTKHVEHGEDYDQKQAEWLEEMKKDGKRTEF